MAGKKDFEVDDVERVVQFGKALDHPTRVGLLIEFHRRDLASATVLAKARVLELGLGDINYHIIKLMKVGALKRVESRSAKGGKEHYYSLTDFGTKALRTAAVIGRTS